MAIVVRNEGAKVNSNINVTPMVDVMLVLLIKGNGNFLTAYAFITRYSFMAMTVGGPGVLSADINVTPFIDILLVLLIIFMVITPLTPHGLDALVPQPPPPNQKPVDTDRTVVVQVLQAPNGGNPRFKINQDDVASDELGKRLTDS